MSSVSAVSYQTPITGAQKVDDERTESQAVRNTEAQTGKDSAVRSTPAPGTGTKVDVKA
jgi:hypothetical protein